MSALRAVLFPLAAVVLCGCPSGASVSGRVVLPGVSAVPSIAVRVTDDLTGGARTQTVYTASDGSYSFEGGEDIFYILAHADSTLEGDITIQFYAPHPQDTAPDIVFTPLGSLAGTVTIGGQASGNGGIVVGAEGTSVASVTDDTGKYELANLPVSTFTIGATLTGHAPVSLPDQTVQYAATTVVPPLILP